MAGLDQVKPASDKKANRTGGDGFIFQERTSQAAFLGRTAPTAAIHAAAAYRLKKGERSWNLAPTIRDAADAYFGPPRSIVWHRHADHGLSSQACCLNFFVPLATEPLLLSRVIGNALGIEQPKMMPVEPGPGGADWFVGFEWTGKANYLDEWAQGASPATRGANATSADAVVRFEHEGRIETLLIEWKYTERYGAPIKESGSETRRKRYADKAFAPNGPIRSDLGLVVEDFFWEPFYQLLRQQMLAWRMAEAHEDRADRVRVLHLSPVGNRALHKVTAPKLRRFGDDAFEVFKSLLVVADDFIPRGTEQVFGPILGAAHEIPAAQAWADYLLGRYGFLTKT